MAARTARNSGELLVGLLLAANAVLGCGASHDDQRLLVFAAASTIEVVSSLASEVTEYEVHTSFGPSSALARQIEDGAPAGVFVSASAAWVRELAAAGLVHGEPLRLATNGVVCVARRASSLIESGVSNASELAAELPAGDLVAIADRGVPVGEYTRQSLHASGDWDVLSTRLVGQVDTRDCLRSVLNRQAAAGFVYSTDALQADVQVLFELEPESYDPAQVWAVRLSDAPAAKAFMEHLAGDRGRAVLRGAGFTLADETP